MLHLIPGVKILQLTGGQLQKRFVCPDSNIPDTRVRNALHKLPISADGCPVRVTIAQAEPESYTLDITADAITITAGDAAGAFYAVQTLRQLFDQNNVPYLHIEDKPDFSHRGFYHDVTRGKIATVDSIKELIDNMTYYKLNSLQLYVEHTFGFDQCRELNRKTGYLTKEELLQIGDYCRENFIEFIPSLSSFGHMYELLQQPQYQHLRVLKDYVPSPNYWVERMRHHTIDPLHPDSMGLVGSLIDQYYPLFESDWFNICCDETFDLKRYPGEEDPGRLYVDFVKQIIAHVKGRGKKVMMWADILLQHPEVIDELPEDICFLNWKYIADPPEENIAKFAQLGRKQIVCPGTTTWNRFCEDVDIEEQNICKMASYGYKYGALGVLNTNWGDWGNPCSMELAMYGLVLGAEKSWCVQTPVDDTFYAHVDALLYRQAGAVSLLKAVSQLQNKVLWKDFVWCYIYHKYDYKERDFSIDRETIAAVQADYTTIKNRLASQRWERDEYRQEMLIAAQGICLMAELFGKLTGIPVPRLTDAHSWTESYSAKWRSKNKESELKAITDMFLYCETC